MKIKACSCPTAILQNLRLLWKLFPHCSSSQAPMGSYFIMVSYFIESIRLEKAFKIIKSAMVDVLFSSLLRDFSLGFIDALFDLSPCCVRGMEVWKKQIFYKPLLLE